MLVSDLSYLENVTEDINIEGAGYADFYVNKRVSIYGQRIAEGELYEELDVYADEYKSVDFSQELFAIAHV